MHSPNEKIAPVDCEYDFKGEHFKVDANLDIDKRLFDTDHIASVDKMCVTHASVYTTPLDGIYRSSPSTLSGSVQKQWTTIDYHAFVVLKISSGVYVSAEKQVDGICMSKSNNIDHVKYCFGKVPRKFPVKESIADNSDFSMLQLLKNIRGETGEYELATNNCQHLAQRIFGKVALNENWEFERPIEYLSYCLLYFIAPVFCSFVLSHHCYLLADWYTKYPAQEVVPQDFPNLFNNWLDYIDVPEDKLIIDELNKIPNISTFMLVELVNRFVLKGYKSKAIIISENISKICSLSTVPDRFIQSLRELNS